MGSGARRRLGLGGAVGGHQMNTWSQDWHSFPQGPWEWVTPTLFSFLWNPPPGQEQLGLVGGKEPRLADFFHAATQDEGLSPACWH